jgi:sulfhydrogenase subunit beta (sulfur reductase)
MTIKKLNQSSFDKWVETCIKKTQVYGVQAKADHFEFAPLSKAADLRLDYDVTFIPPKKYFQPPRETLLKFDRNEGFESVYNEQPFVLFGVHPYDVIAISQNDRLFEEDNFDPHYMKLRQNSTIVACDVQNASVNVFAGCMGTATVDKGFDILLTKVNSDYLVDIRTDKGELLAESIKNTADADEASLNYRQLIWKNNVKLLQKHTLKMATKDLPKLLEGSYGHPVWEEKAKLCYSCGSCNLVCPTCYCFDVRDDVSWDLQKGERYRVWDGCMLTDFATVAGGHNFRNNRADRYRHRYYRKGKYIPEKIGEVACVGCGRCVTACTAKISNPVEVYNRLLDEGKNGDE